MARPAEAASASHTLPGGSAQEAGWEAVRSTCPSVTSPPYRAAWWWEESPSPSGLLSSGCTAGAGAGAGAGGLVGMV